MLRCSSKQSAGNHVVSPEEEKERLRWEGFASASSHWKDPTVAQCTRRRPTGLTELL